MPGTGIYARTIAKSVRAERGLELVFRLKEVKLAHVWGPSGQLHGQVALKNSKSIPLTVLGFSNEKGQSSE